MKNIIKEIGPILAGFQLATYLVGFFSIGAFANWVLNSWRPFTHWVWDTFFDWLNLPDLTALEKDALTAVVFFLPMFVWSIYLRYVKKEKGPFSNFTKIFALIFAIIFLYLVAGSLIIETVQISIETLKQDKAKAGVKTLLAYMTLFGLAITALTMILGAITAAQKVKVFRELETKEEDIQKTKLDTIRMFLDIYINEFYDIQTFSKKTANRKAFLFSLVASIAITISLVSIASGLFASIGWIRGLSILLVVLSIYFTLRFDPRRLLVTTGAFLAFIISSLCFEIVLLVLDAMKSIPTQ